MIEFEFPTPLSMADRLGKMLGDTFSRSSFSRRIDPIIDRGAHKSSLWPLPTVRSTVTQCQLFSSFSSFRILFGPTYSTYPTLFNGRTSLQIQRRSINSRLSSALKSPINRVSMREPMRARWHSQRERLTKRWYELRANKPRMKWEWKRKRGKSSQRIKQIRRRRDEWSTNEV